MIFPQLLINGLIAGAVYTMASAGFSLIYGVCGFVNFSHGSVIAVAGYVLFFLFKIAGINFWLSAFLAVGFSGAFGFLINRFIFKKFRKKKASALILLLVGFALLLFFEALLMILFGADVKTIGFIKIAKGQEIFGAIITPLQIVILFVSLFLFVCLLFFMKKTKTGKAMRAVADNKDVAEIVGISSEKIFSWTFVLGSLIAGCAGVLLALEQNLEPTMGTGLMIKGFTASIIGGIGNVPAAVLGSFLLGLAENFGIWFLPSGYKDAIAFVVLFIFLLARPQGILGRKK